jgi:hypothetical protein
MIPSIQVSRTLLSAQTLAAAGRAGIPSIWCETLARQLVDVVTLLWRRQAARIPESNLNAYLAMQWLRWNGGALVLTPRGQAVHDAHLRNSAP